MGSSLGWRLMAGKAKGTLDNWKTAFYWRPNNPRARILSYRPFFSPMLPPPQQISCFYRFPLSDGRRYPQPLCGYLPFGDAGYNRNEIRWYPRYQSRHCDRLSFFFYDFYFYFLYAHAHPAPFLSVTAIVSVGRVAHPIFLSWPQDPCVISFKFPPHVCIYILYIIYIYICVPFNLQLIYVPAHTHTQTHTRA